MKINRRFVFFETLLLAVVLMLTSAAQRLRADTGSCSGQTITLPFNDILSSPASSGFFCFIAQIYFQGVTVGTSATTYSPDNPVTRGQMAAFLAKTEDLALKRGSRRAALGQFWTVSQEPSANSLVFPGTGTLRLIKSDGTDVYIAHPDASGVYVFTASGSQSLGSRVFHPRADSAFGIAITPNHVYVTGRTSPGRLYRFSRQAANSSPVELLTSSLGAGPTGIAYDGERVWTANSFGNSVSIYNPTTTTTTTIAPSFSFPLGILYDGANIWVTNRDEGTLVKLDQNGTSILQTVTVGQGPSFPMFDGTNIWVPNSLANTISVVRAATGQVLATLTGNGLNFPLDIAFDGQRVMVTNNSGNSLSLWKATDLTPLGSISVSFPASSPFGVCSDGQDFWVTLSTEGGSIVQKY